MDYQEDTDRMDWDTILDHPPIQRFETSLASRIHNSLVISTFDTHRPDYLTEPCIRELITKNTVEDTLQRIEHSHHWFTDRKQELLAHWIQEYARKIFIITLLCDLDPSMFIMAMSYFKDIGFTDKRLPVDSNSKVPNHTPQPGSSLVFHPRIWPEFKISRFSKQQWCCLAPVFSPARYEYNLSPPAIFPFTKANDAPKKGAFSSVHKVEIHEHHQHHHNLKHVRKPFSILRDKVITIVQVAIKEITVEHNKDYAKTDKAWDDEARALEAIRTLDHPHVVNCLAAIRRGDSRYFMFPWANGDSLKDAWDEVSWQELDKNNVYHAIQQLQGIADALHNLHNFNRSTEQDEVMQGSPRMDQIQEGGPVLRLNDEYGEEREEQDFATQGSIRHGDLKPENILRFRDRDNPLGILKIADLGLAKQHVVATQERVNITSMRFGTMRYEAPETAILQARSRLYDIWSMGCITFEYIIWLLYGNDQLNKFYSQLKGENQQPCQYFEVRGAETPRRVEVREVVVRWMDHIEKTNPAGPYGSAIRDLLQLVRTRLLVVSLPSNRPSNVETSGLSLPQPGPGEPITRYRATALELRTALNRILLKTNKPGYLLGERANGQIPTPSFTPSDLLSPPAANRRNGLAPLNYPQKHTPVRTIGHSSRRDYTVCSPSCSFHKCGDHIPSLVFCYNSSLTH
jgi:serine/threonine protein kinase